MHVVNGVCGVFYVCIMCVVNGVCGVFYVWYGVCVTDGVWEYMYVCMWGEWCVCVCGTWCTGVCVCM